jgi:glyoxylase I family protein
MTTKGIPGLQHVDHAALTVPDLDAAMRFYCDVIGGEELYRVGPFDSADFPKYPDGRDWGAAHLNVPGARLTIGMIQIGPTMMLELFRYEKPGDASQIPPRNHDLGGHHVAFKVSDIDAAVAHLKQHGVRVFEGPMTLDDGPLGGLSFVYFLDPWGNQLELVSYQKLGFMADSKVKTWGQ